MRKSDNIPHGYQDSSLGTIPKSWEVKKLGDLCQNITSGKNKSKSENGRFPVYGSTGIIGYWDSYMYDYPMILVARVGANAGLINNVVGKYDVSDNTLMIIPNSCYDFNFAYNQLLHLNLNKLVFGSGQPLITAGQLKTLLLPLPPIVEQQKIAEILSVWDEAIEKQTQLIIKLETRKHGLMQQLLTGENRLKRFSEKKQFCNLKHSIKEVSERNRGNVISRVLSVTNSKGFIQQEEQFDRVVASQDICNYKIVREGQFAYNPSRVNVGSLDLLRNFTEGILSPMYVVFKADSTKISTNYLFQLLRSSWFTGHIPMYVQGSVRDSLSFDGLCAIKFFIPSLEEQVVIADILSAADEEINIAKEKLAKLNGQKKGLMQVLLTGKKRVTI